MKCPYCGEEMKKGYLKSNHLMFWGEEKELGLMRDDLKLTKPSLKGAMEGHFVDAFHCGKCGKIMVCLDEEGER